MKTWLKIFYHVFSKSSEHSFLLADIDAAFYYLLDVFYAFILYMFTFLYIIDEHILRPLFNGLFNSLLNSCVTDAL